MHFNVIFCPNFLVKIVDDILGNSYFAEVVNML